jgi:hypothetical protein
MALRPATTTDFQTPLLACRNRSSVSVVARYFRWHHPMLLTSLISNMSPTKLADNSVRE